MNITIIGTEYVGFVSGTCFAEIENHLICVDIDQNKIDRLHEGVIRPEEKGFEYYQIGKLR